MKKYIKISVITLIFILIISYLIMSINGWKLRLFEEINIKEIDGKNYIGIASYSNRLRKNIKYYEDFNFLAYKPSEEYIEEFYDYTDYEHPEYREYHKIPITESIIYYFDKEGNIIDIATYNENGAVVKLENDEIIK